MNRLTEVLAVIAFVTGTMLTTLLNIQYFSQTDISAIQFLTDHWFSYTVGFVNTVVGVLYIAKKVGTK